MSRQRRLVFLFKSLQHYSITTLQEGALSSYALFVIYLLKSLKIRKSIL
jgi:hypothetical protein